MLILLILILILLYPVDAVAGSVHCCLLSEQGILLSFGKADYTGHGGSHDVLVPKVLNFFVGTIIKCVSVGPGNLYSHYQNI
jgi:hypothetical protein